MHISAYFGDNFLKVGKILVRRIIPKPGALAHVQKDALSMPYHAKNALT